ncbi:MAG: hypothetical protein LBP22_04285 [Deltaproteobacteria bacterium]|jgi:nitrogenase molybdenum-iron protein beta chain|nr:hypothetical protein [Deltaproteobacteria bacterium]
MTGNFIERPRWTCALGGALAAVGNLPQTVPILHSGPGCAGNFAWTNNGSLGLNVTGPCLGLNVPATNIQEKEVVFGGLDRLREEIENALSIMDGQLYFVLTGCLPEVIGDDVEALISEFSAQKIPIISASPAGFKGDSYYGYEEVLKTLIRSYIRPTQARATRLVNVWGLAPGVDPFWRGNLDGIRELLSLLDLKSNFFFGPDSDLTSLAKASRAAKNIVVSGLYGLTAAKLFQEKFGVDYVQAPLPIGASASERFLKIVGRALKIPGRKVNRAISNAGRRHYVYLEPIIDVFNDMEAQRHVLIVGDANYALALSDFFAQDLGWLPELVAVVNDLSPDSQKNLLDWQTKTGGTVPGKLIFENRLSEISKAALEIWPNSGAKYFNSKKPVFVAGSSLERELAKSLGAAHLSLTYPISNRAVLTRGYTGYSGGLNLTEDAVSAVISER